MTTQNINTVTFKAITVAASAFGGGTLGLWAYSLAGFNAASTVSGVIVGGLAALAASSCALAFFQGFDAHAVSMDLAAETDRLTGLPARRPFLMALDKLALDNQINGKTTYFVDIEFDRFKQMNDALGFRTGDKLIELAVQRMKNALPQNSLLGRLGVAEFGFVIPEEAALPALEVMLNKLVHEITQPYMIDERRVNLTVSAGVCEVAAEPLEQTAILRRANLALNRSRAKGRNMWSMFEIELGRIADHRRWLEAEMQSAIDHKDFELHYQPQLNLLTGTIVGYEALVRWRHPEKGLISPVEFIGVAEETGLIAPLGDWVLRQACADARNLPDDSFVAVNLSAAQFLLSDMVASVKSALEDSGLPPHRLELEITESLLMEDREKTSLILGEFAKMGVSVAVDDFGTGYSNLTYLADLPFQKLKIDRSFVNRIEIEGNTGAIISTIIGLSRALGVRTTAEGVENENQAILLRAAGCDVGQGYLYGRPAPISSSSFVSDLERPTQAA